MILQSIIFTIEFQTIVCVWVGYQQPCKTTFGWMLFARQENNYILSNWQTLYSGYRIYMRVVLALQMCTKRTPVFCNVCVFVCVCAIV